MKVRKDGQDSIGRLLKVTNQIFETYINNSLKEINLTSSQIGILVFLCYKRKNNIDVLCYKRKNNIDVNQIDIQKKFKLSNPTVSGILDRLEEKRFIKRINNGRSNKIIITDDGMNLLDSGYDKVKMIENNIISGLSLEEREELKRLLSKIIENNRIGDDFCDKKIS